jgi:hypothetical protein
MTTAFMVRRRGACDCALGFGNVRIVAADVEITHRSMLDTAIGTPHHGEVIAGKDPRTRWDAAVMFSVFPCGA